MTNFAARLASIIAKREAEALARGEVLPKAQVRHMPPTGPAYRLAIIAAGNTDQRAPNLQKLIQAVIPNAHVSILNLRSQIKGYWVPKRGTKASFEIAPEGHANFALAWERIATREGPTAYDAFICADIAFAHHTLPADDAKSLTSIDVLSGMIIETHGKPVLFHFDPLLTYGRQYSDEDRAVYGFMSGYHIKKLYNRLIGLPIAEKPTKIIVPKSSADLRACEKLLSRAALIAADIETSGGLISVIGFAAEVEGLPYVPVIVIPTMTNMDETCRYWIDDAGLLDALETIGRILQNPVPKAFHNGSYDLTYIFRYGWWVNNFIYDTMHMLHAMWPTMPKSLYIGASMFCGNYRYWKDDGKDIDEQGKKKWQVPTTPARTANYWIYNGLDCANTLELCLSILQLWTGNDGGRYPVFAAGYDYVWRNYIREFAIQFGPAFYMSMHGLKVPVERQLALKAKLLRESDTAKDELDILLGDPDFNPNSAPQLANLYYDVLNFPVMKRHGRTTDKRVVQVYADSHPIYDTVVRAIQAVKEPRNNASKYADMEMYGGRLWCQVKAGNTTTSRLATSKHNRGYGTNQQNVPKSMRIMCVAEDGELLVSSDYGQSDSYFVAFESQDETMIETVLDDRDTHSVHVEFFFGSKYEDVVAGAAASEPWVVDPVFGQRQIIKKVTHGTNYDMGGGTMLMNVRRDAALAMIHALLKSKHSKLFCTFMGKSGTVSAIAETVASWPMSDLEKACDFAQALYYKRYPRLKEWKKDAVSEAWRNNGVIPMFGGTSTVMLCKPTKNPRFVPAAKGQGGTAGNINNAMLRLYFLAENMWRRGFRMVLQVHDELVVAIPEYALDLVAQKVAIMESSCTIAGRTFVVPVEAELSKSWSAKHTIVYKGLDKTSPADYLAAVLEKEQKLRKQLNLA